MDMYVSFAVYFRNSFPTNYRINEMTIGVFVVHVNCVLCILFRIDVSFAKQPGNRRRYLLNEHRNHINAKTKETEK